MKNNINFLLTLLFIACTTTTLAQTNRYTVYTNGNIYTMDPSNPHIEAFAVKDGRIVFVGSSWDVEDFVPTDQTIIDLDGKTVLPGLIDAHGHLLNLGSFGVGKLDLSSATSYDDLIAMIRERVETAKPNEWIVGGRWDHESWPGKQLPTHDALSAISPNNPVWLSRVDGHAGLANAAALKRAGIDATTKPPAGGDILRDENNRPTGMLIDRAMNLVTNKIPSGQFDTATVLKKAQEMCFAVGLTGVHDAGVSYADLLQYRMLVLAGDLKLRVHAMIHGDEAIKFFAQYPPKSDNTLNIRACKIYMDGALGSRGAWMLEPYADRKTDDAGNPYTGLALTPRAEIEKIVADAVQRGYQVCTHAIGDRANREVLDIYKAALKSANTQAPRASTGKNDQSPNANTKIDHRFRIEHAQILAPTDIPRFGELGVIASMQPTHCTTDMRWVPDRIGPDRAQGAYAWQSILKSNGRLALGSDFPVESPNPFYGIHAAVTRQDTNGNPANGWLPSEKLSREAAIAGFTRDAAYASFDEDTRGTLSPGKFADFVIIDRDIMTCPPADIRTTKVLATYINNQRVYKADE